MINTFLNKAIEIVKPDSVLFVKSSNYDLFSGWDTLAIKTEQIIIPGEFDKSKKYDLIIFDLSIESKSVEFKIGETIIFVPEYWATFFNFLPNITENGFALILLGPWSFVHKVGRDYENMLNDNGFFVNAIFGLPEGILKPHTAIKPMMALVSRKETSKTFFANIFNEEQAEHAAKNWFSGSEIADDRFFDKEKLGNFFEAKIRSHMDGLIKHSFFEKFSFLETVKEIRNIEQGECYKDEENVLYISKHGEPDVISSISKAKMDHHKYYQVFMTDTVCSEYLELYFKSSLGQDVLNRLVSGSTNIVTILQNGDAELLTISLPKLKEQKKIVETQERIKDLKEKIDYFQSELAIHPESSYSIIKHIDNMLIAIDALSDADKIRSLIREGESKQLEFKETLSLNVKKPESIQMVQDSVMEDMVFKTIAAFLNSNGGTLLIGVHDSGDIMGVEKELLTLNQYKQYKTIENKKDRLLLHFKDLLKERIGEQFYPFIEHSLVPVVDKGETKHVLMVECQSSNDPCYLDDKCFYVRTNPATDQLEGNKMAQYLAERFYNTPKSGQKYPQGKNKS
jgi:hypothetical protein